MVQLVESELARALGMIPQRLKVCKNQLGSARDVFLQMFVGEQSIELQGTPTAGAQFKALNYVYVLQSTVADRQVH